LTVNIGGDLLTTMAALDPRLVFPLFISALFAVTTANHIPVTNPLEHRYIGNLSLENFAGVFGAQTIENGHEILLLGGCLAATSIESCNEPSDLIYSFNSDTQTLTLETARLPKPRFRHSAALLDGNIYLFGGENSDGVIQSIDVLNIGNLSDTSTIAASISVVGGTAFASGGKVYFAGGFDPSDNGVALASSIVVDGDAVSDGPSMRTPRGDIQSAGFDEFVYIVGGKDSSGNALNTMEVFNSDKDVFELAADKLTNPRSNAGVAYLDGKIYAFGGDTTDIQTLEIFIVSLGSWTNGGELGTLARLPAVAADPEHDSIYLFGGVDVANFELLTTFSVFIERTELFSAPPIHLHGSGTSNPSEYYWEIIERFEVFSRFPLQMTYRSIGSGGGQDEFIGTEESLFLSLNHFGSGDVPMSEADYATITQHNHEFAHIPVGFGAVGIYVNIPELEEDQIQITPCELAQIFTGEIKQWSELKSSAFNGIDEDIFSVYRATGSSSTSAVTSFLEKQCLEHWNSSWVGKVKSWPCNEDSECTGVSGSGDMQETIAGRDYSIGYLSVGHGYPRNVKASRIRLENGDLLEPTAAGIQEAADIEWPEDPFDSFAHVSIANQEKGWPMSLVTYLYVRKDLTGLGRSAALLKAFITYILDPELGQDLITEYNYVSLTTTTRELGEKALEQLELPADVPEFTFEISADAITGASPYTLSNRRKSYSSIRFSKLEEDVDGLQTSCGELDSQLAIFKDELNADELKEQLDTAKAIAVIALLIALLCLGISIYLMIIFCKISKTLKKGLPRQQANGSRLDTDDASNLGSKAKADGAVDYA